MRKKTTPNIVTVERKNHWPISVWLVAGLLLLHAILAWPMLQDGFTRFIESIEGAHLTNAAWVLENGGAWNSLWYFGFPAHLTYPPLLPNLIALVADNFNLTISHAYRITVGVLIWLIPLGIYLFTRELTKRKTIAVLASLMFIVMPNIAYFLIPQVQTIPDAAGWIPYHWVVFAQYGEGPHMAALFFMLLAATFFLRCLDNRSKLNLVATALFLALTMLTNLFAGFALILILVILQLGRMFIYVFDVNWRRLGLIGLVAYGITTFAFDYTFIKSILASGYVHPENTMNWPPFLIVFFVLLFLVAPITLLVYHMVVGKDKYYPLITMAMWAGLFLLVAAVYYYFDYNLVTQPNRYLHEAQIGTVVLVAMGMTYLIDNAKKTYDEEERFTKHLLVTLGIFTFILAPSFNYLRNPHWIIQPQSMDHTYEKQIANQLNSMVNADQEERVYLTGTPAFWLNVFSDVPQIRGGADNAQPVPVWADASYLINKSANENLTKAWLNLLNVRYILVNYPESGTYYVDYENFDRFTNWTVVDEFAEGGFKLYEVPESNLSIFTVVKTAELNELSRLDTADQVKKLAELFNQADNSRVEYEKLSNGHYRLQIKDLGSNETVVFKMNADERWQAAIDENILEIETVGPNYMAVAPLESGLVEIDWSVEESQWEVVGMIISLVTLASIIYWLTRKEKK